MRKALRSVARVFGIVGVVLGVLAVRMVTGSAAELRRGDRLAAAQDVPGALSAYRRAARSHAPANPYCAEALGRIEAIARRAEAEGDLANALVAWRALRGAVLATRSFYVPHRARLRRAERAIPRLNAALAPEAEREEVASSSRRALSRPPSTHLGWTLLLLAGWLGWTGGAFAFARGALDEEDRLRPTAARLWGTVVVVGFGLFVIGMALA